jgi:ABC-type antimicrobial peptide transport system permease subunit
MAYAVAQRSREFGVRMALGAQRVDVMRLVLGEGIGLAAAGLTGGILCALVLTRLMASVLFDVKSYDPLAYASIACLLALVAGVACLLPARRATRIDPAVALRGE